MKVVEAVRERLAEAVRERLALCRRLVRDDKRKADLRQQQASLYNISIQ